MLTELLSPYLIYLERAHIVDHTALNGRYDFKLDFMRIRQEQDADDGRQSVIAAVETLGLELKPAKVPIQVLVIDHLDQVPVGN